MSEQQDSSSQNRHIASLELRNFQLHKDTKIEFSPGLNIILGSNNRGKSTIMRAIQYLVTCRPTTEIEGLTRWGNNALFIKLTMSDGSWVIREKGKDINQYQVYDARKGGDPLRLSGFGISVPEQVVETLGMGLVSFGNRKNVFLNLSQQDEVFLIGEGEIEMARWMYSITNLNDIRGAMDQMTRECRTLGDQVKDSDIRIDELQRKMSGMPDLDMLMMALQSDEEIRDRVSESLSEVRRMEVILDGMMSLKRKAIPVKNRIDVRRMLLAEVTPYLTSIEDDADGLRELIRLDESIDKIEGDIAEIRFRDRSLVQKKRIDMSGLTEEAIRLEDLLDVLAAIEEMERDIGTGMSNIAASERVKEKVMEEIIDLEKEMFGDDLTCPLCGQVVGEDLADHIVMEDER